MVVPVCSGSLLVHTTPTANEIGVYRLPAQRLWTLAMMIMMMMEGALELIQMKSSQPASIGTPPRKSSAPRFSGASIMHVDTTRFAFLI
jgi:hypothetical protein